MLYSPLILSPGRCQKLLKSFLYIALALLTGCSAQSRHETGTKILKGVGLVGKEEFPTGEKRVRSASTLTPEEEHYLGRAVAAKLLSQYKIFDDRALSTYLQRVGGIATLASSRPETFGGYHFAVLDTEDVNAISAPGGFIFITRGLLRRVTDEDALASILAHEIGHVSRRHGLAAIKPDHMGDYMKVGSMALSALDCSGCLSQLGTAFAGAVDDIVQVLLVAGYSRDQEYEADSEGMKTVRRLGYDSEGIIRAFNSIKGNSESGGWLSSHPAIGDRIEVARRLIDRSTATSDPALRQARFDRAMRLVKAVSVKRKS